jgi:hypothetical protein
VVAVLAAGGGDGGRAREDAGAREGGRAGERDTGQSDRGAAQTRGSEHDSFFLLFTSPARA